MKPARVLWLTLISVTLVGCTCRRAVISPRAPVDIEIDAPWDILEIAEERAVGAETLQMQGEVTISGEEILGRWGFTSVLHWRRGGDVRLLLNRPPPVTLMQFAQRQGWLTVYLEQERRCFQGPIASLDDEIRRQMPVADSQALVAAPLIDDLFVDRLSDLSITERPNGSCWRHHLFLRGNPREASDPWWRQFDEEIWALRRDTLTVEGVALRLPGEEGEDPLWLWAVFDEYDHFDTGGEGERCEEGPLLPGAFRLSLVRHPWRRWRRGEVWRIDCEITKMFINRSLRDQIFEIRIPRGTEIYALQQMAL